MTLKSVLIFVLTFFSFIIYVTGQGATNNLRCYICESKDIKACDDPMDRSVVPSVDCSSLIYPSPREGEERSIVDKVLSNSTDGKFRGAPIIGEIFQGSAVGERSLLPFKYICLKVTLIGDGMKGTTRTCEQLYSSIQDACDFIKHDVNPRVKVVSCGSCDTDNCNSEAFPASSDCDSDDCDSGSYLNVSILTLICCSLVFILRQF